MFITSSKTLFPSKVMFRVKTWTSLFGDEHWSTTMRFAEATGITRLDDPGSWWLFRSIWQTKISIII